MVSILNAFSGTGCGFVFFLRKLCVRPGQNAGLPPLRVQLCSSSDVAWAVSRNVREIRDGLISAGFISAGTYEAPNRSRIRYMMLVHEASSVIAVIAGTARKTWLDISTLLADGGSISISSGQNFGLPLRPGHKVLRVSTTNVRGMHEQVLRERGSTPAVTIASDTARALLEVQYAEHMNWLVERGGYTREEICRALLPGRAPNHRLVFLAREKSIRSALAHWWKLQPNAPSLEATQFHDRVTIVHDDLPLESLGYILSNRAVAWKPRIGKVSEHFSPRQAFAKLNRVRGEPMVKIFEKTTPLRADFYCRRELLEEQEHLWANLGRKLKQQPA